MFTFESTTILNERIDKVFDFFCNAENLQKLTPDSLNFKIKSELPIKMEKGALIDYRINLYGIPVNWKTEITEWEPPYKFEDTQLKGPYKLWKHQHIFKEVGNKTEMTDIVDYNPKGWPFNTLLNKLFVRKEVEKIFQFREQKIQTVFQF